MCKSEKCGDCSGCGNATTVLVCECQKTAQASAVAIGNSVHAMIPGEPAEFGDPEVNHRRSLEFAAMPALAAVVVKATTPGGGAVAGKAMREAIDALLGIKADQYGITIATTVAAALRDELPKVLDTLEQRAKGGAV